MTKKVNQLFERVKTLLEPSTSVVDGVVVVGDDDRYFHVAQEAADLDRPTVENVHEFDAAFNAAVVSVAGGVALATLQEQPEVAELPFSGSAGNRTITGLVQRTREFPNPKGGDPITKFGHTTVQVVEAKNPELSDARKSIATLAKELFGNS